VNGTKVIAVEEHFQTRELNATFEGLDVMPVPAWQERLFDLDKLRLEEMDAAGIDVQIISHIAPGVQNLGPAAAIELARHANDTLQSAIARHPDRFAGFAELPTPDPAAAAKELERTVKEYGFKGAVISGLCHGHFMDERQFWPILEKANELRVPIYIHPSTPHPAVVEAYYKDYPTLARAGWGFGIETSTHAVRLIMSGALDEYPNLKFILGHMGEGVPFWMWRADRTLTRDGGLKRRFRDYFLDHFVVTTSGNFSASALSCCLSELGVDKILFAVDWPMQSNLDARRFVDSAPISDAERKAILGENAQRIFAL
jgi:predicted TIM-barrel fold metal-dependent hydrolase